MKHWNDLKFFREGLAMEIYDKISKDGTLSDVTPPPFKIFRAFELCPYDKVKAVILGQDPYPTKGHANGLAFSCDQKVTRLPASLRNIFQELVDDVGVDYPAHGDLSSWARQGVLLLNSSLTTRIGEPGAHLGLGWEELVKEVLDCLSDQDIVYILWGKKAQDIWVESNPSDKAVAVVSPHPSPFSARRGFFGSKPFSRTNEYLEKMGKKPIDWAIT